MADIKKCLVVSPIGEDGTETRRRSDIVLEYVIRTARAECGYEAYRADHISKPGLMTTQVIERLFDDPLVVADLSERNPNVFYELAIRHAIKKPLIQVIEKSEPIPFGIADTRTIKIDHHDLKSANEGKREIIKQVKYLEDNPMSIETPISIARDLHQLRQSGNPEQRSIGDILTEITGVRAVLADIEKRVGDPGALIPREYLCSAIEKYMPTSRVLRGLLFDLRELLHELIAIERTPLAQNAETQEVLAKVRQKLSDWAHMLSQELGI